MLDAFGLDAGAYTFPYAAAWSGGKAETVTAALESAKCCAAEIRAKLGLVDTKAEELVAA